MPPLILDASGRPIQRGEKKTVAAKYDAAQTTSENSKHWSYADALSADTAANPAVRQILRNRSRYEVANNSYARGIVNFIANDTIGQTIRLVMKSEEKASRRSKFARRRALTPDEASFVEGEFYDWMEEIKAADKLRTMRAARVIDGEGFGVMGTNTNLESMVKLDLALFEAEMCQDEVMALPSRNRVDGITFDNWGNAQTYRVLKDHPGSGFGSLLTNEHENYQARDVIHLFVQERPGQRRGIPQLTPALPLFAQLRRFTLAVIAAAETAADFAAILYTNGANEEAQKAAAFDVVEIERRMMQVMPEGWDMRQFKAEQPVSTYAEFVRTILREINRCLETPMNVAIGDSSGYNYASGKLDWQIWEKARSVDRHRISQQALDHMFKAWRREATLIEGYLPQSLRNTNVDWSHGWLFDGDRHQDPLKEASAQEKRLRNNTTTLADEYGRQGADWEEKLEQIAREREKKQFLGIPLNDPVVPDEEDEEDEEPAEVVMSRDATGRLLGIRGSI